MKVYKPGHGIELSVGGGGVLVRDHKVSTESSDADCYIARDWDLEMDEKMIKPFVDECIRQGFRYALAQNHPLNGKRGENEAGVPYFAFGRNYFRIANVAVWDIALDGRGPRGICVRRQHQVALSLAHINYDDDGRVLRVNKDDLPDVLDAINHNDSGIEEELNDIGKRRDIDDTTRKTLIDARIGQGKYRAELLGLWEGCCAVTGCSVTEVLVASHIQPWRSSNDKARLDPHNGLPLIATLDALFDKGLISFGTDGEMLISEKLPPDQREILGVASKPGLTKRLTELQKKYMEYHRKKLFRKDKR